MQTTVATIDKDLARRLLTTKLFVPPNRAAYVSRSRLVERLDAALQQKLTLISAPAGFGKTTLVSDWLQGKAVPVAWLSLDALDREPTRFLMYLLAACQSVYGGFGREIQGLLLSPQVPPPPSFLPLFVNELAAFGEPLNIVLDDYHMIDNRDIDEWMAAFLEHLPPFVHVVMTTREDPQFPLAKWRVRGELMEVRAEDLRLTTEEAASFFRSGMGLSLSNEQMERLLSRTEGWAAGLQLAGLSMQGREQVEQFVETFAGDHRFVLDYLAEEVLMQQPEDMRSFLLETSILGRLCGPLCVAVTGRREGLSLLEAVERSNLFLVSLDDTRRWFRYHHLFADVLLTHARKEREGDLLVWHKRASEWFAGEGEWAEAISHAFASEDDVWLAGLLERSWPVFDSLFQANRWLVWARRLPASAFLQRPVLCGFMAWALLNEGELDEGLLYIERAEAGFDESGHPTRTDFFVEERERLETLSGSMHSARAYVSQSFGRSDDTIFHAERALALLPEDAYAVRGPAAALLGLTYVWQGKLEEATQALRETQTAFLRAGEISFAISCALGVGEVLLAQGRKHEAVRTYQEALSLGGGAESTVPLSGVADMYLQLGELARESGGLAEARRYLEQSAALPEQARLPDWSSRRALVEARLAASWGRWEEAFERLGEAERLTVPNPLPPLRPHPAQRALWKLRSGDLSQAQVWVEQSGLSLNDDPDFVEEFSWLVWARVLMGEATFRDSPVSVEQAEQVLEKVLLAARKGERKGSILDALLALVQLRLVQEDQEAALAALREAVQLSAGEGFVQRFVEEGSRMVGLLETLAFDEPLLAKHVARVIEVSQQRGPGFVEPSQDSARVSKVDSEESGSAENASSDVSVQLLVEPLSEREREVLVLIAEGLSNKDISKRLFVAVSTVKGHNQNIFGKLAVKRRTEAVAKARKLGLL